MQIVSPLVILFVFLLLIAGIGFTVSRAKKKKTPEVREQFAFRCVLLLFAMAGDLVAGLLNPYSLWDFAAAILNIEKTESTSITVIRWILSLIIFLACCWILSRTYKHWDGGISRQQYRLDMQGTNKNSMFLDFFSVLCGIFFDNPNLKKYTQLPNSLDYNEAGNGGDVPWYIEFAHIYRIRSNQAQIDIQQDWHAEQHCFVSPYATHKLVAAYCLENMPNDAQIKEFLNYIHKLHKEYFKIIVAIKEGSHKLYTRKIDGTEVEFQFKEDMLDNLVDFTGYYRAINTLYHKPLPQGNGMRIEDVYVSINCCVENSDNLDPLEPYVFDWLDKPGLEQLAILGDFGMGKTLFSTSLVYHMIKKKTPRIPILIPLRNKSPRNSQVNEIFSYFTALYGIHPDALNILNANGRLLLIFDGFDEMDLVGNDDIRKLHFRSLWSLITPKSKVLITGRPNYFLSQSEMHSVLGVQIETKELPHFMSLTLQPFTKEQIRLSLRNAPPVVRDGICSVIDSGTSSSFLDLIRRPSHLFLVSQIWEDRHLASKVQNLTSASILNEFLMSNFERQAAKGTQNPYFYLSPVEREYFMIGVAMRMYKMGVVTIARELFEEAIIELVEIFPEQLSNENSVCLELRNGKSVKSFAQADSDSMLAIINDVRTCGILINDYANNGFCFAHKSLYDLLVAKYFQGQYLRHYDSTMAISQALSSSAVFSARLGNDMVIRKLTAELISGKIAVVNKSETPEVMCRHIFIQCKRVITPFFGKNSPKKVFKRYLKRHRTAKSAIENVPKIYKYRFLSIILTMICGPFISFLIKGIKLTNQFSERAISYYDVELEGKLIVKETTIFFHPPDLYLAIGMAAITVMLVLLFGRFAAGRRTIKSDDLLLLTWYYTCVDNQIPKEVVCKQAYPANPGIFENYINGYNFALLQEKMHAKKKTFRAAKN